MNDIPFRKRGGQPGNRNAYRHGFYSHNFKEHERRLLAQMSPTDLSGEIELMRVEARRFMQAHAGQPDDLDFETQMSALRAVILSVESINSLIRTQYTIAHSPHLTDLKALDEALSVIDPFLNDDADDLEE